MMLFATEEKALNSFFFLVIEAEARDVTCVFAKVLHVDVSFSTMIELRNEPVDGLMVEIDPEEVNSCTKLFKRNASRSLRIKE